MQPSLFQNLSNSLTSRVRQYLINLQPFQVISLTNLYQAVRGETDEIRSVFYRYTVNTPSARNYGLSSYHAVRFTYPLDSKNRHFYFSLPEIEAGRIRDERCQAQIISQAKATLSKKYGHSVVSYWLISAQRRSVDIAAPAMTKARNRDKNQCFLCKFETQFFGMTQPLTNTSACHLLSRRLSFWNAALNLNSDKQDFNLFDSSGTQALVNALKQDKYHSNSSYIVCLCRRHDKIFQKAWT